MDVTAESLQRRTFAIISHPDAGKTTLTEKFLLYSGAVQVAGAVHAREGRRSARSDWMELEQQRGISISSTVLQFPYVVQGGVEYTMNLLDTPGHRDFSEDTYRVLSAVDAVVMVLDAAKGIESQTLKLFQVCRSRNLPVITFLNKYDRPGREPLSVLTVSERSLALGEHVTLHLMLHDLDDQRGALKPDARGRSWRGDLAALQRLMETRT